MASYKKIYQYYYYQDYLTDIYRYLQRYHHGYPRQ